MLSLAKRLVVVLAAVGFATANACVLTTPLDELVEGTPETPKVACTAGLQIGCPCLGSGVGVQICGPDNTFGRCLGCDNGVVSDSGQEQDPSPITADAPVDLDAPKADGAGGAPIDSGSETASGDSGGSAGESSDAGAVDSEEAKPEAGAAGGAGTSGSGGAAGSAGQAGAGGSAGAPCPTTSGGPPLVRVAGGFCIGATEVTRQHYADWLSTAPSSAGQPALCSWNNSYVPVASWPPASSELNLPVVQVDWCDAYAYCKGVGARLCGAIGGGPGEFVDTAMMDPAKDQWMNACSSNGVNSFPYGNSYEGTTCNGDQTGNGAPLAVGSLQECSSSVPGYEGVYDLSGNVWEWEDACSSSGKCRIRGGGFGDDSQYLACGYTGAAGRDSPAPQRGFRCCGP